MVFLFCLLLKITTLVLELIPKLTGSSNNCGPKRKKMDGLIISQLFNKKKVYSALYCINTIVAVVLKVLKTTLGTNRLFHFRGLICEEVAKYVQSSALQLSFYIFTKNMYSQKSGNRSEQSQKTVSNHRRWIPNFFLEYCAGSCSGTLINHMWQLHIPPKNRANAFCPLSPRPKCLFVNEGVESTPKKRRSPTRGLPISLSILNGLLHTHKKKKNTRAGVLQVNRIHWGFQRITDVFPLCALFRVAAPRDFTCRVLSRDKGLSAERLSARYPAGNTYQAALQVWQKKEKKRKKKIFMRLVIGKCQQSARTAAFLKITRETKALHDDSLSDNSGRDSAWICSARSCFHLTAA